MQNGIFIRVFIASPGDVYEERDEACRVVHNWNAAHSMSRSILCLLYTSPSPRDLSTSRMPSSA